MGAGDGDPLPALAGRTAHERGLVGVEIAVVQTLADPLDDGGPAPRQRALVEARAQIGG